MRRQKSDRRGGATAARKYPLTLCAVLAACLHVCAQRLPFHSYGVRDGLAHAHVNAIHQDGKGYLWFGTWEGLSRFDGYGFTNYGTRDGLANPIINDIAEDRRGNLWVATLTSGVARLIDDPKESPPTSAGDAAPTRKKFINYSVGESRESNVVGSLLFDAEDTLWCVTEAGIYRARLSSGDGRAAPKFELVASHAGAGGWTSSALSDAQGRLWFGFFDELIEISHDRINKYRVPDERDRSIVAIQPDWRGGLFVANHASVFEFLPPSDAASREQWRRLPLALPPRPEGVSAMLSDRQGALWIGTPGGLVEYRDGRQTTITTAEGLSDNAVASLFKDRADNLWVGTGVGGVCRLSREKFVSFTKAEGLLNQDIAALVEDRAGHIYASASGGGVFELTGGKAVVVPGSTDAPFNQIGKRLMQDARGDWWVGTEVGLFRFRGPRLQFRQGEKFRAADGIPESAVFNGPGMYEDPAGRIWIGLLDPDLYLFDPARTRSPLFRRVSLRDVWQSYPRQLIRDGAGALWVGGFSAMLRLVDDKPIRLEATDGLPEANPRSFFLDSRGWLWIGLRFGGVSVVKDPAATPLKYVNYSTTNGLSSDAVWAITEDDDGRMYFGTGKGLDQLDVRTGVMRHFTTGEVLAGDTVNDCLKDRRGDIWAATTGGVTRFDPRAENRRGEPPPVYLSRVRAAGEDLPISETGAVSVPALTLTASQNNLLVEYVGLSFEEDQKLKYQYKLEGTGADWSAPAEQRAVNYAHLAPGSYKFLVRAVTEDGVASPAPASFEFHILPPVWQRWWFVSLAGLACGALAYAAYRRRVARLIELERVRTRIATELHDDIGSNLSRIALLSEVVRREAREADARATERLAQIANVSRESVDSMSDIVWAINPERDHLGDLTQRIRRVAGDVLAARDVEFRFRAGDFDPRLRLDVDTRREVFLVFKEALNNAVRHAACVEVVVEFGVERGRLVLRVMDDGAGFDPDAAEEGNGLASMRRRAANVGGELRVETTPGAGTTVTLRVPLDRRRWLAPKRMRRNGRR